MGLGHGAAAPRGKSVGVTLGGVNLSAAETEGEPEEKWGRRGANRLAWGWQGWTRVGGPPLPPGMRLRSRLVCLGTFQSLPSSDGGPLFYNSRLFCSF